MKEYNPETHITISRKAVTFHKVCTYLIERLGTIALLLLTVIVLSWSLLQVLLTFKELIN